MNRGEGHPVNTGKQEQVCTGLFSIVDGGLLVFASNLAHLIP